MPNLNKKLLQCKHPNSRKAKALTKQIKKKGDRERKKLGQHIRQNILGEKVLWFRDHLEPDKEVYNAGEVANLIECYLSRFDEELQQIVLKHSVGKRKNRQHANREDIIKMTIERERTEYCSCGLEIPDILDFNHLQQLKDWNGELRFLQNLTVKRITKQFLDSENNNPDGL